MSEACCQAPTARPGAPWCHCATYQSLSQPILDTSGTTHTIDIRAAAASHICSPSPQQSESLATDHSSSKAQKSHSLSVLMYYMHMHMLMDYMHMQAAATPK
jgi:hypothetical protein